MTDAPNSRPIDRTYISAPIDNVIYIAEYERRNSRALRWSAMIDRPATHDRLIDARRVPVAARRAAQAFFQGAPA